MKISTYIYGIFNIYIKINTYIKISTYILLKKVKLNKYKLKSKK